MKLKFISLFALFSVFFMASGHEKNNSLRNFVILSDQSVEHVASGSYSETHELFSLIHQKSTPFLVSQSLWRNFLERKKEFKDRSERPQTREAFLKKMHEDILTQVNHWSDYFKNKSQNWSEIRELITQQINDEFCNQEVLDNLEKEHIIPPSQYQDLHISFLYYLVEFDPTEWIMYKVTDYYYLLIPKAYLDKCMQSFSQENDCGSSEFTQQEVALGLKISSLPVVHNPLDISQTYFPLSKRPEFNCIQALHAIFIPKELHTYCYTWNIYLSGHGMNLESPYNKPNEHIELIANLSIDEFKMLLSFLEHTISTNLFVYSTCYGAGRHLIEPYLCDGQPMTFNYSIIVTTVGDTNSYTHSLEHGCLSIFRDSEFSFKNYVLDTSGTWKHDFEFPIHIEKFFKRMGKVSIALEPDNCMREKNWLFLGPTYIETIPNIRRAGSDTFVIYNTESTVTLSPLLVALKKSQSLPYVVTYQEAVLLGTTCINIPFVIKDKAPKFVATVPNRDEYYFQNIVALENSIFDICGSFWPIKSTAFTKSYALDELECSADDGAELAILFDKEGKKIHLLNILIYIEADYLMRIFFQNEKGLSFSCYVRFDSEKKKVVTEGFAPLHESMVGNYLHEFDRVKQNACDAVRDFDYDLFAQELHKIFMEHQE